MCSRDGRLVVGTFPPGVRQALLALMLLTGCAGSGSSGFDASFEAAVITQAMDEGSCVVLEETTYCGSGAPLSVDDGMANVLIDRAQTPRTCTPRPAAGCPPFVPFVPDGFPAGTAFRAARAESADGPWALVPTAPSPEGNDAQLISLTEAQPQLVAVLVYIRPVPEDLPAQAKRLADLRADAVYVHQPFDATSTQRRVGGRSSRRLPS